MTDIELTTANGSDLLIYIFMLIMGMGVVLVALHVYMLPAISKVWHNPAFKEMRRKMDIPVLLYKALRGNHEATGGTGYIRKG